METTRYKSSKTLLRSESIPEGTLDLLHGLGMRRSELVARHAQDARGDYTLVAWCGTRCGAPKCFLKEKNISSALFFFILLQIQQIQQNSLIDSCQSSGFTY
jgi:hypothetical protein